MFEISVKKGEQSELCITLKVIVTDDSNVKVERSKLENTESKIHPLDLTSRKGSKIISIPIDIEDLSRLYSMIGNGIRGSYFKMNDSLKEQTIDRIFEYIADENVKMDDFIGIINHENPDTLETDETDE